MYTLNPSNDILDSENLLFAVVFGADKSTDQRIKNSIFVLNALNEYDKLKAINVALLDALKEISEGKGAFSRDPLTHADNCINDMKQLAIEAIKQAEQ